MKILLSLVCCILLFSCAVPGPNGETVYSLDLGPDSCVEAQQFAKSGNAAINYMKQIEASGEISTVKLVEISQEIYLLNGQAAQACRFFSKGQISFEQYQSEMKEVRSLMLELTKKLPQA